MKEKCKDVYVNRMIKKEGKDKHDNANKKHKYT